MAAWLERSASAEEEEEVEGAEGESAM